MLLCGGVVCTSCVKTLLQQHRVGTEVPRPRRSFFFFSPLFIFSVDKYMGFPLPVRDFSFIINKHLGLRENSIRSSHFNYSLVFLFLSDKSNITIFFSLFRLFLFFFSLSFLLSFPFVILFSFGFVLSLFRAVCSYLVRLLGLSFFSFLLLFSRFFFFDIYFFLLCVVVSCTFICTFTSCTGGVPTVYG